MALTPFLLYPSLFLILLFSSINHHFHGTLKISPPLLNTSNHFHNNTNKMVEEKIRSVEKMEEGLAVARAAIKRAGRTHRYSSDKREGFVPRGSIYRNSFAFHQSHIEMQKRFKVWTYKEGEPPLFHDGPVNDIYSIEGQFIDELDDTTSSSPFMARTADEATVFFVPMSVVNVIRYVYRPYKNYSRERLQKILADYIDVVSDKYPYWNRSKGGDHFLISCHDWAPDISAANPNLFKNFIRVLCNANTTEGFQPKRDVSLPEINLPFGRLAPPNLGQRSSDRPILAFFAGGDHGEVRKLLFQHWKEKDEDVQVHDYLPNTLNYTELMGQSKFCLCPSGYEVASPRVVESIHAGCVPVIVSNSYVLPFTDVLNWSAFSVNISVEDIPKIKTILQGISTEEYVKMQSRVMKVRRHFVMNRPAQAFDVMHMVMHSVWLRRLNIRLPL